MREVGRPQRAVAVGERGAGAAGVRAATRARCGACCGGPAPRGALSRHTSQGLSSRYRLHMCDGHDISMNKICSVKKRTLGLKAHNGPHMRRTDKPR